MPRELRLKIAREYLDLVRKTGDSKGMLFKTRKKHHICERSLFRYVAEFRGCQ